MIGHENLGSIMGAPVIGPDDDKIGTVGQVFVDPNTGAPNWVTVHTGLFGRHETFVPLDDATWDREVLHIPFEKDLVKDAPRIDTDEALTPQAEDDLYRYYRMGAADASGVDRPDDDDHHQDRDDANTDAVAATSGSMRLRKYTVTEEQKVTVPVAHEEVRLEPDPDAEPVEAEQNGTDGNASNRNRRGRHRA